DRRGERWRVTFSSDSGNLLAVENPVNHASNFGYATSAAQLVHEKTSTTRGGQVWTTAYNTVGDVTDATDPMHHKTHFDYSTDGRHNLTAITPPADGSYG